jgi:hypothetical protein
VWLLDFGPTRQFPGDILLSRAGKSRHPLDPALDDASRRNFLVRCCQGASATLFPITLRGLALPFSFCFDAPTAVASGEEFHLQPHYRAQRPLDAILLKTRAGLDSFITEKYHDQIAAILAEWSSGLLRSPQELQAVEKVLAPDFLGSSMRPVESRLVRSSSGIEVSQNKFGTPAKLGKEAFAQELRSAMAAFAKVVTAEFQVTAITASLAARWILGSRVGVVYFRRQRISDQQMGGARGNTQPLCLSGFSGYCLVSFGRQCVVFCTDVARR